MIIHVVLEMAFNTVDTYQRHQHLKITTPSTPKNNIKYLSQRDAIVIFRLILQTDIMNASW